jgi:histidinol-phosphate aminotransferase
LLSQEAAEAALANESLKNDWVAEILLERGKLIQQLRAVKIVKNIYPSDANFVLVKVENAKSVYSKLVTQGIILRDRSSVILCDDCLRITVGTPEENKLLLKELNSL